MKYKVLIIDDQKIFRKEAKNAIAKTNAGDRLEVIEAEDGQEAIEIFVENKGIPFVVTDINMPKIDGIEMLNLLKTEHAEIYKDSLIFVMTTEVDPGIIQKGKEVGVTAWLIKPIDWGKFSDIIEKSIDNKI
jgi:two-component system, chemotaxis family, chemotaxis protein CheY